MFRTSIRSFLLFSVALVTVVASGATPTAPSSLCIDTNCVATPAPAAGAGSKVKWRPGHYLASDTQPVTTGTQGYLFTEMDMMDKAGKFQGFANHYTWYWLETAQGVYNTSLIDADIARLSTHYSKPYRLIIVVGFSPWGPARPPSIPQVVPYQAGSENYRGILPDYIWRGVSGLGPDAFSGWKGDGYTAAVWRAPVMDRYIALLNFLAKKYDGNPNVEAIVALAETGFSVDSPPPDLNNSSFSTQMKRMIDALAANWPTTNKILNNNWGATNTDNGTLVSVSQYAASKGVGFGDPDIIFPPTVWETIGAQVLRGAGGVFGATDYRGVIPTIYRESGAWPSETAADIENYTFNTLKASHVMWMRHPEDHTISLNWLTGVLPALTAVNYRTNSACPTVYVAGCK